MRKSCGRLCMWAVVGVIQLSAAWCQSLPGPGSLWPRPFAFDATNMGLRWAVTGSVKGSAVSDGKTVVISVERAEIYRPKTFDQPQEVTRINASILRHGSEGNSRYVRFGNPHPVNQTLNPDQTVQLGSFEFRIPVADYPLLKGDTLLFDLVLSRGTVPIYVRDPLPVTQVAAYCVDTMEEFKKPGSPLVQAYRVCHDSAGRERIERWYYSSASAPKSAAILSSIEIRDPVAGLIYSLDPREKKAQQRKGFDAGGGYGVALGGIIGQIPGSVPSLKPVESDKVLGTRQINGVEADGKLHTTVYPAGYQGRAEEVTTTEETWYSFQIQAQVRRLRTDPRYGDNEYQVTNIELGEPDARLFRVPADYQVAGRQ